MRPRVVWTILAVALLAQAATIWLQPFPPRHWAGYLIPFVMCGVLLFTMAFYLLALRLGHTDVTRLEAAARRLFFERPSTH
jgi:hypothetical protein